MKSPYPLLLPLTIVFLGIFSCSKEEVPPSGLAASACYADKKMVRKATNSKGIIGFNQELQKYALYVGVAGSYDSQIIGVPCNLAREYEKQGLKVTFSGRYKEMEIQPAYLFAGQEYFYLEITKIALN
jgi:hypothetical protein